MVPETSYICLRHCLSRVPVFLPENVSGPCLAPFFALVPLLLLPGAPDEVLRSYSLFCKITKFETHVSAALETLPSSSLPSLFTGPQTRALHPL